MMTLIRNFFVVLALVVAFASAPVMAAEEKIFAGADLRGKNFANADLRGADLSGANLVGADLTGADLSGADLRQSYMRAVQAKGANFNSANL